MSGLLLSVLGPVVIGPLTFLIMQQLKHVSAAVEKLPVTAKRFAVAGIAGVLTLISSVTGVAVPCDVSADVNCLPLLDKDVVKALVSAAVAFGIHALKKSAKDK